MNTKGNANMALLKISLPEASMASTVPPSILMPERRRVKLTKPVEMAPPSYLITGWMEKVTDSLRLPSFQWPYSTVSARNMSIKV